MPQLHKHPTVVGYGADVLPAALGGLGVFFGVQIIGLFFHDIFLPVIASIDPFGNSMGLTAVEYQYLLVLISLSDLLGLHSAKTHSVPS